MWSKEAGKHNKEAGHLSQAAWRQLCEDLPDKSQNHQAIQEQMLKPKTQRYVCRDFVVLGRQHWMKKKDVGAEQVTS